MIQGVQKKEKATLGVGCFWCAEAAFKLLPGVVSVMPGYAGGTGEHPTYEEVSRGTTGHSEVAQIEYDPLRVSYADILKIFWEVHDPAQKGGQGADVGSQYRAVIFYHTESQKEEALASKAVIARQGNVVQTEIRPFVNFYPAEAHHRDYYDKNPYTPYSQAVIAPKVKKVKNILARA
ncbi:MAG: peptide-methionine (S)-S-oxide reductase MsrA [Candidatus Wildermuthbacteria bacterium]|nr:peptide-methionine (S)-S-oxide reductase MsrA [Candidatus Wildermuthbacteria bacterium]